MKLVPVKGAPHWLKRHPDSSIYWVDLRNSEKNPPRLTRSTKERDSKQRALAKAIQIIAKWTGENPDGSKYVPTFGDMCDDVLLLQEMNRPGTKYAAKIHVGRLKTEFGSLTITQMTEHRWRLYEAAFRKSHPGKFFINAQKHMSLVMNHAYRNGHIEKPWRAKMSKDPTPSWRIVTDAEKTALMKAASPDLRDQLVFAMTMGMRLREHLSLAWSQIDLERGTLELRPEHTKTKKARTIALSAQAKEVLQRRLANPKLKPEGVYYVFPGTDPRKPQRDNKVAWIAAKRRAGIKGRLRYQDLRHTFATECARMVKDGKISIALVCHFLGHSIRVFETTYLHLCADDSANIAGLVAVNWR